MKHTLIVFIILISRAGSAQIATKDTKIITKHFHECLLAKDVELHSEDSIANRRNYNTTDDITVTYPYVKTPDKKLNAFINDTIQKLTGVYKRANLNMGPCYRDTTDYYSNPSTANYTFTKNFVNRNFISLTIRENWNAGGGGNGFSDASLPLTFDLASKKILRLKDVINKGYYKSVCTIILNKLKKEHVEQLENFGNMESLAGIEQILDRGISVSSKNMVVFWTLSLGRGVYDADVTVPFKSYPQIFKKDFLEKLK